MLTGRRDDAEREGTLKDINIHASKIFVTHDLIPQKCKKRTLLTKAALGNVAGLVLVSAFL